MANNTIPRDVSRPFEVHDELRGLAEESISYLWDFRHYQVQKAVFATLLKHLKAAYDKLEADGDASAQQKAEYDAWRDRLGTDEVEQFQSLTERAKVTEEFLKARVAIGIPLTDLVFCIDPTEPTERLRIQKEYDVKRAVQHFIISGEDYGEFLRIMHDDPGRCYFEDSPYITEEISLLAELRQLQLLGDRANVDNQWAPAWLANIAGVKPNGRPADDAQWKFHQRCIGYSRIEEQFAEEWASIQPPTNPFGRPQPYKPTTKKGGHWPTNRGNAPAGINDDVWDKVYNAADSRIGYKYRSKSGNNLQMALKAREDGTTRDSALQQLIEKGNLPPGFVDNDP